jgi:hypothetical protein
MIPLSERSVEEVERDGATGAPWSEIFLMMMSE